MTERGTISDAAGNFEGWHYQLVGDPISSGAQAVQISDGSVLVVGWPAGADIRPLPARLLFVPRWWLRPDA